VELSSGRGQKRLRGLKRGGGGGKKARGFTGSPTLKEIKNDGEEIKNWGGKINGKVMFRKGKNGLKR